MTAGGTGTFTQNANAALADPQLQKALEHVRRNFVAKRREAADKLPEFDQLRDEAKRIKDHALAHLDIYLEEFERKVVEHGGEVHWALSAAEARGIVLDLLRSVGAKTVTKGKSMISEEIGLNAHLEAAGIVPVETDLGEYIIQLRGEPPSHIIAPAVHLTKSQVAADFRRVHEALPKDRALDDPVRLVDEARSILRERFIRADVGITGANFLIAETGTAVIVTNEGNGDLTQSLPRMHIVLASIEKIVPTLNDASTILRVLARSATGQEISTYTTFSTGPRRPGDPDGPEAFHVVILDNGRTEMLAGALREALRCIRCGACINHCPVYQAIGGHAYGAVYPGPIGSVLTPALYGLESARDLPHASTFCGRCEEVCPMRIPIPNMLRHLREREVVMARTMGLGARALRAWAFLARRPGLYRRVTAFCVGMLRLLSGRRGAVRSLPLASSWTAHRDVPVPEGGTFMRQWEARRKRRSGS
jgi:L-lactate dehydrogenase complex protein LldF